jgi:antitoxin (DNA-binding transcriptional repressor) of toxin-antitoxin stability system
MMGEVQIGEASLNLANILARLEPGQEVAIVDHGKRLATIRKEEAQDFSCKRGSASGKILYMADDFDAPLDDFAEYMQ